MTLSSSFPILFMGTPNFALPSLQALVDEGFEVVAVYSQPPRPKGRGYEVTLSPVHGLAQSLGLRVLTPPSLRTPEAVAELKALAPQAIVVAAYGLILPQEILNIPPRGCINVHGSLLPRWRGAAPMQRALLAGDQETGVALMHMEAGLDTGPVYETASCAITAQDTASSLQEKLSTLGARTLVKVLRQIQSGTCPAPKPQPEAGVTYAHKLTHEEGMLQWSQCAQTLDRAIRALNPWPGTFTYQGQERLKILEAYPEAGTFQETPGTLLDNHLLVACGTGALRITKLQKQGGKALAARDFLNGHPLIQGNLLTSHAPV